MREILFRGKRLDNGEWVEGSLLKVTLNGKTAHLIFGDNFSFVGNDVKALSHALVDPTTVGQYTGLTNKHGKRIFEGDVVVAEGYVYVCQWDECNIEFGLSNEVESFGLCYVYPDFEVIGNIHDNPELLKGGEG